MKFIGSPVKVFVKESFASNKNMPDGGIRHIFIRVADGISVFVLSFRSCGAGSHGGHDLAFSETDVIDERT